MTQPEKPVVVLNPRAAGGQAARRWIEIQEAFKRRLGVSVTLRTTEHPGHATALTRNALEAGSKLVIAIGGDGTVNEVANGFLQNDEAVSADARLGFVPIGTGGDLQRTLGISSSIEQAVEIIAAGVPFVIDVGKARLMGHNGTPVERYFVNLLSFGMGGDVSVRAKNFLSPLGGKVAFLYATFAVFVAYRGKRVRLTLDGVPQPEEFLITNIAIGNGRFHGGGMQPCPRAIMNDGHLEVTVIDRLTTYELLRNLPILYSDNIYQYAKVRYFRTWHVCAESDEVTRIEVDGEALGRLPLEVSVLPRKLPILIAPSSPLLRG